MPQCYGCHLEYQETNLQRDWISGDVTPGKWEEKRFYMRFDKPALGIDSDNQVYPITPCQVVASLPEGDLPCENHRSLRIFTLSAFDPHSTAGGARECLECHGDPKTLGLGEGILQRQNGKWVFRPTYEGGDRSLGMFFPLDRYVTLAGERVQKPYRTGARPLNGMELERVLSVSACIGCHNRWDDPIYVNFSNSTDRFLSEFFLPCKR
jgi:hypothetical protein